MNRTRRLTAIGAGTAGLLSALALTGAASASAATVTSDHVARPAVTSTSAPATDAPKLPAPPAAPATDAPKLPAPPAAPATDAPKPPVHRTVTAGDRAIARVKAVVLAKYPHVTITKVVADGRGGWTVSVATVKGRHGVVTVDRHLNVGTLVLAAARHRS
jgi:hypothetical protein